MARSTCSGTEAMSGKHFMPATVSCAGLTGYTVCLPFPIRRFLKVAWPTVPSLSVAPMRATVLGLNILSMSGMGPCESAVT